MREDERWAYIVQLDEELLVGGVILSEWCSFLIRDADIAYAKGAYLASLITAVAAIETHLRYEALQKGKLPLARLIDQEVANVELRNGLHHLRIYRNQWVHVADTEDDQKLLSAPTQTEQEVETMAAFAIKVLRQTIYMNPFI
jgi:hypothetical protein